MKTILVTGGAGGIGEAICKRMAQEGYAVIVTYNSNADKATALIQALALLSNNPNITHSIFHAPVNDAQKRSELSLFIKETYGKLDILVNNAGITTPVPHDDLDGLSDEWIDKILETNVKGSFAMIRACKDLFPLASKEESDIFVPHSSDESKSVGNPKSKIQNSFGGLIVNISSIAAVTGVGSNVMYCASKAAIDSMTRSLARALAPNIRVVSVAPGWVLGEYAKKFPPEYIKAQEDLTPLGRLATPEDVADTIFAIATYMPFMTGNVVPVDGGRPLR